MAEKLARVVRHRGKRKGKAPPVEPPTNVVAMPLADDGVPSIRIIGGELPQLVDQAEAALIRAGASLYQRDGSVVHAIVARVPAADGRVTTSHRIAAVAADHVAELMTKAARWLKFDKRSEAWICVDAPPRIASTYLARAGLWRLPPLAGVITAPTLRPDGSVLATAGYDAATALLFQPGGIKFPPIPERPSREEARRALTLLCDLLEEFPFVAAVDRAVALSAILTALVRRSLPTAPLHAFTAPVASSGKTLLVDIASMIATGDRAPVSTQGENVAEMEKRLGACMIAADQIVCVDNCSDPLGGDLLCQVLTQPRVRIRILGLSLNADLSSAAAFYATGNNLTVDGDLVRRVLLGTLDPRLERPELRRFNRDPLAMIAADRGRFVAAGLTIIRAYQVAGRPSAGPPLASFETWCRWVRDPLVWLREPDVADTIAKARSTDTKLAALAAVIDQWASLLGSTPVTARLLIERTVSHPDLRDALLAVAGDKGTVNARKLGKWLSKNAGRIIGGRRIVQAGQAHGVVAWKCEAA